MATDKLFPASSITMRVLNWLVAKRRLLVATRKMLLNCLVANLFASFVAQFLTWLHSASWASLATFLEIIRKILVDYLTLKTKRIFMDEIGRMIWKRTFVTTLKRANALILYNSVKSKKYSYPEQGWSKPNPWITIFSVLFSTNLALKYFLGEKDKNVKRKYLPDPSNRCVFPLMSHFCRRFFLAIKNKRIRCGSEKIR